MIATLKKLLVVSRPISWVNTAYPFAAGYLLTIGTVDRIFVIGTLFFLIPYNLVMYGVNDVFDYESDIRNPRKGGIEGAVAAKKYHTPILLACAVTALPFIVYMLSRGEIASNLVFVGVMALVVAYSAPGLRFKERPFLDSLTSSSHFVGPLVYALALAQFPGSAWPYVIAFFMWGVASHAFGAVQDIIPDRKADIGSIATVISARWTVRLAIACYSLASLLVILQGFPSLIVGISGFVYALSIWPYRNVSDKNSEQANAGWRRFMYLNYLVGAIVTVTLIYSQL